MDGFRGKFEKQQKKIANNDSMTTTVPVTTSSPK